MSAENTIAERLRRLGITGEIRVLNEPAPTAASTAEQLGCAVAAIVNSLIFTADGRPLLVLCSGAHRVDTKRLARQIGAAKIRQAAPDLVLAATGQHVGGVGPVGHPSPIRTVIDWTLATLPNVWAGAGLPHLVFQTTFAELAALTGGTPVHLR